MRFFRIIRQCPDFRRSAAFILFLFPARLSGDPGDLVVGHFLTDAPLERVSMPIFDDLRKGRWLTSRQSGVEQWAISEVTHLIGDVGFLLFSTKFHQDGIGVGALILD